MFQPKKAPRSPKFCVDWLATATNQEQAISLATWLKTRFRGHLIQPQSPTFCGFHPSELPKRTPRPPYLGRCSDPRHPFALQLGTVYSFCSRGGVWPPSPTQTGPMPPPQMCVPKAREVVLRPLTGLTLHLVALHHPASLTGNQYGKGGVWVDAPARVGGSRTPPPLWNVYLLGLWLGDE